MWQNFSKSILLTLYNHIFGTRAHFLQNSMKRPKDRTLKDELPRPVGAQYATGDEWRNNCRKNEAAAAAAKSLQSCPTLCDPIDGSPPGSPIPGILQARTPEWVAISFSNAWKWKVKVKSLSRVGLLATSWTAAYQAPPSMGFSRQIGRASCRERV